MHSSLPEARTVAEPTPDETTERRYLRAIDALVDDAVNRRQVPILADTLAWTCAKLMVRYGDVATGDILKRLGGYIVTLVDLHRAQEEAERERKDGRPVQ